jgi:hypothetical protein
MGGKAVIQDEFTGQRDVAWRYTQRRIKKGICLRCSRMVPPERAGKLTCGCDKVRGVKGE